MIPRAVVNKPWLTREYLGMAIYVRTHPIAAVLSFAIGCMLSATVASCATIKADASAAKTAIVDCAKADAGPILGLVAHIGAVALASQINGGAIDWPAIEGSALVQGKVVGGCALSRFVAALAQQPKTEARALVALPDPASDGQAAVARLSAKFDGAIWQ